MEGLATYMSPVNRLASYLIVFLVIAALPYSSRADDFSEVGSPTVPLPVLKCLGNVDKVVHGWTSPMQQYCIKHHFRACKCS